MARSAPDADRIRFEQLYRETYPALLGHLLRRVSGPTAAADVLAETYLVAWRRIQDVPVGGDARPWLFGVARRALANHERSPGRASPGSRWRSPWTAARPRSGCGYIGPGAGWPPRCAPRECQQLPPPP